MRKRPYREDNCARDFAQETDLLINMFLTLMILVADSRDVRKNLMIFFFVWLSEKRK